MVESNSKFNVESSPKNQQNEKQVLHTATNNDDDDADEKAHTFRRRRLSLSKHHLQDDTDDASVESEKSRTFRDRRLTLPHSHSHDEQDNKDDHHHKNNTLASPRKKLKTTTTPLKSRTHHAGHLPPASPKTRSSHPLYQAPLRVEPLETSTLDEEQPAWCHRHTFSHEEADHKLPFPRSVVGTYSCHGVEPVYDSEEEEEDWMDTTATTTSTQEKVSTVAKINQDRGGVAYPYAGSSKCALFAAYDGHGQGGELVSQFALHEIQKRLEHHEDFTGNIEKAFSQVFVQVDQDLTKEPLIEPMYAGTTACVVLIRDDKIIISNAGDSRAVLARRSSCKECWQAIDLSQDQNPDNPKEQERIVKSGGFVSPPPEPGLSARVWLDENHSQIGLAMARSIGDHAVAAVGVIAEPVVTFHDIKKEDDFMILATDGVWEFIDSQEAVRLVGEHIDSPGGATKACQALIEAAAEKWHEEEGNYRDDITALVVRLQDLWTSGAGEPQDSSSDDK